MKDEQLRAKEEKFKEVTGELELAQVALCLFDKYFAKLLDHRRPLRAPLHVPLCPGEDGRQGGGAEEEGSRVGHCQGEEDFHFDRLCLKQMLPISQKLRI